MPLLPQMRRQRRREDEISRVKDSPAFAATGEEAYDLAAPLQLSS